MIGQYGFQKPPIQKREVNAGPSSSWRKWFVITIVGGLVTFAGMLFGSIIVPIVGMVVLMAGIIAITSDQ